MSEPVWIDKLVISFAHAEALAEHGGAEGVRDEGLLESALARPKNVFAYEGTKDLARLAAVYAVGIVRNHPFVDGNKRVAFIALALFLALNGMRLRADQVDAFHQIYRAASGEITEEQLSRWVQENAVAAKSESP
jgi:death on curing protein